MTSFLVAEMISCILVIDFATIRIKIVDIQKNDFIEKFVTSKQCQWDSNKSYIGDQKKRDTCFILDKTLLNPG